MFRGANNISIDAKGRMAVPTRFRECLESCCTSQLVITVDTDRCLLVYPLPEWLEIERKLVKLPSLDKVARHVQRMLIGNATEVEMDGQGRILLPPYLRTYAGLGKRAVLIGQGQKFELWDEERWNGQLDKWQETDLEQLDLPADLESLSL
ncbi:Cell division protein MraZ [hydrothermal vent metagenome]|uniref:Transcriptional regulator MraZ n=1 Tax=hydrothermal vent metagenome TaxID=652676 RepID=A0A3B1BR48_9ZZZZ